MEFYSFLAEPMLQYESRNTLVEIHTFVKWTTVINITVLFSVDRHTDSTISTNILSNIYHIIFIPYKSSLQFEKLPILHFTFESKYKLTIFIHIQTLKLCHHIKKLIVLRQ